MSGGNRVNTGDINVDRGDGNVDVTAVMAAGVTWTIRLLPAWGRRLDRNNRRSSRLDVLRFTDDAPYVALLLLQWRVLLTTDAGRRRRLRGRPTVTSLDHARPPNGDAMAGEGWQVARHVAGSIVAA